MGVDTCIYFRASADFSEDRLERPLPKIFSIRPLPDYLTADYPDATHELDTCARFYGEGYERGPWPDISAALMILFASDGVERVWYGGDCTDQIAETKPEDVLRISAHFMANGHRPYGGRCAKISL